MVSMYTSPIVSSLTTWLELTLEMPGVDYQPYRHSVHRCISQPTSMTSGVFRQAITPVQSLRAEWAAPLMPMLLLVGEMPMAMGPSISRVVGL